METKESLFKFHQEFIITLICPDNGHKKTFNYKSLCWSDALAYYGRFLQSLNENKNYGLYSITRLWSNINND